MKFEERYQDILHNIESAIIQVYRQNPDLLDHDVETAINNLIRAYKAEGKSRQPRLPVLNDLRQEIYDGVKDMCDWRLGRLSLANEDGEEVIIPMNELSKDEVVTCLKRIQKSIRKWSKSHGRQGYLNLVSKFVV